MTMGIGINLEFVCHVDKPFESGNPFAAMSCTFEVASSVMSNAAPLIFLASSQVAGCWVAGGSTA